MQQRNSLESTFTAAGSTRALGDGESLYAEGSAPDEVFLVLQGALTMYRLRSDGSAAQIGEKVPGDLVGEAAALDQLPRTVSVRAAGPASLAALPAASFRDLLQLDVAACYEVAVELARALRLSVAGVTPRAGE